MNHDIIDCFMTAFSVLIFIIDPPGLIPIYLGLTQRYTLSKKRKIALKAAVIGFSVLLLFAILGDFILDRLNISGPAFRIAGGILLLLTAIDMVVAHHLGFNVETSEPATDSQPKHDVAVFPLGIPLIAGPGSIVSIVMLMRQVDTHRLLEISIIAALLSVVVITYLFLLFSTSISRLIGTTGANVLTRIFGIILAALAIQYIINGINDLLLVPLFKS